MMRSAMLMLIRLRGPLMMTMRVLDGLDDTAYDRVVDERFDPPVTAAVRLVSVIGDASAHLGQIGYVRGLAQRSTR